MVGACVAGVNEDIRGAPWLGGRARSRAPLAVLLHFTTCLAQCQESNVTLIGGSSGSGHIDASAALGES
eukprot:6548767-Pyramimonas_sp.AAC.1